MKIPQQATEEVQSALAELVEAGRILESEGHGDKVLGHVTLRDPDGRGFWMKRAGVSLAELEGPQDFVLVDFDDHKIAGDGVRHAEWPIHSDIFLARPDINVIGHTHPYAAGVLSATEEPLTRLTRAAAWFDGDIPRYRVTSNLIITHEMGKGLADALGNADAVLMRNHGITYGGATIAACVHAGLMMEYACRAQLRASASGLNYFPAEGEAAARLKMTAEHLDASWASLRRQMEAGRKTSDMPSEPDFQGRLAQAHRVLANEGHGFLNYGAIFARADSGEILTKRAGLALSEVFDGNDLTGPQDAVIADFMASNEKVNAVVYSCAPSIALFSATRDNLAPTGDEGKHFEGKVCRIPADSAITDAPDGTRAILLPNDGALIFGRSIEVACLRALFLERACSVQLDLGASGLDWGWLPDSDLGIAGMTLEGQRQIDGFWNFYCRKLNRAESGKKLPGE